MLWQLGGIEKFDFTGIAAPTEQDAQQLGRCLNLCKNLKLLDLQATGFGDEAIKAMFAELTEAACFKKIRCVRHMNLRATAVWETQTGTHNA